MSYSSEKELMKSEGSLEKKRAANYEGFATGGQAGMMLGTQVGTAVGGPVGAAIGAGAGLLVGGLAGALSSGKKYREMLKIQREQQKVADRQAKDASASERRQMFAPYKNLSTPKGTDLTVSSPFVSNFDAFKFRRYGGA